MHKPKRGEHESAKTPPRISIGRSPESVSETYSGRPPGDGDRLGKSNTGAIGMPEGVRESERCVIGEDGGADFLPYECSANAKGPYPYCEQRH